MRESIGGTMLMYIVAMFLVVYIGFMAVVINYGRVFRAKNSLLSYIENTEGFKGNEAIANFSKKAHDLGYSNEINICYTNGNNNSKYFSIRLYINFTIPLTTSKFKIPITGETSAIKNVEKNNKMVSGIPECRPTGEKFNGQNFNLAVS